MKHLEISDHVQIVAAAEVGTMTSVRFAFIWVGSVWIQTISSTESFETVDKSPMSVYGSPCRATSSKIIKA